MINEINISFDKQKVIDEINTLQLKPGHSNNWWRAKTEESKKFWYKTDTWLKTIIKDTKDLHEIERLNSIFESDIIYVYKQLANSFLPRHRDYDVITAINLLLTDEVAPITFDNGDEYYRNALIDVSQIHSVKPHTKDRLLLKFAWHKKTFKEIKNELRKKCLI
tara:strand:- start:17 stop:508 length:492 start_codon:yes stop_codon:yes gene_type:complete